MYAMTYRYSCYECPFACIPRQGDITLADYWGVKEFFPEMDASKGVSLVLVNSQKGEDLFKQIDDICKIKHSTVSDGAKYNGNLLNISSKHKYRCDVYKNILLNGYRYVASTLFRCPNYYFTLFKCQLAEYSIIKRILEWKKLKK